LLRAAACAIRNTQSERDTRGHQAIDDTLMMRPPPRRRISHLDDAGVVDEDVNRFEALDGAGD
jgi:hypothetical protein